MKYNITQKAKKIMFVTLVVIFGLQQNIAIVLTAPPDKCPIKTLKGLDTSLVIEETNLTAGGQVVFYRDDTAIDGCQPSDPPTFTYIRISKDSDNNLEFDALDENIAYFETEDIIASEENKFTYQLPENLNSGIYYIMYGNLGYSINFFNVTALQENPIIIDAKLTENPQPYEIALNTPLTIVVTPTYSDGSKELLDQNDVSLKLSNATQPDITIYPVYHNSKFLIELNNDLTLVGDATLSVYLPNSANPNIATDSMQVTINPVVTASINFNKIPSEYTKDDTLSFVIHYTVDGQLLETNLDSVVPLLYEFNADTGLYTKLTHTFNPNAQKINEYSSILTDDYFVLDHKYAVVLFQGNDISSDLNEGPLTFSTFVITEPKPEDPNKTFTAITKDTDNNGHLDHMLITFPDAVNANTIHPTIEVAGYAVDMTKAQWTNIDPNENTTHDLLLEIANTEVIDPSKICNNAEGNICETGLTPAVTLVTPFQQIGAKVVTATDGASPIIFNLGANSNGEENFYSTAVLYLSEIINTENVADENFITTCSETLELCIFTTFKNAEMATNTFSYLPTLEEKSSVTLKYGDSSKYPFDDAEDGLPKIFIVEDGLLYDLVGNPLLANSVRPLELVTLTSTDDLASVKQKSDINITSNFKFFGLSILPQDLPDEMNLTITPTIEGIIITPKNSGLYTISIPENAPVGTYTIGVSDETLPLESTLKFTVVEKKQDEPQKPVDQPGGNANPGQSGSSGGGGYLPTNKAPKAVIKELASSIVAGAGMNVDGTLSTDPDKDPIFFSWNFGDGTVTELSTLDSIYTHTYTKSGTYTITLKVQDSNKASDTTTAVVTVVQGTQEDVEKTEDTNATSTPTSQTPPNNNTQTTSQTTQTVTPEDSTGEMLLDESETATTQEEENTTEETSNSTPDQATVATIEQEEAPVESEEELPDWLAWLFGSSTTVAVVWTGLLANRYKKYVA